MSRLAKPAAVAVLVAAIATVLAFLIDPAPAQDTPIDGYVARLSVDDHYNSKGVRLDNVAAIIRQDRANVHRFGVSQLHQLRGRIGRGAHPSLCLLATRLPRGSKAGERLGAVAATVDGFELAELDLQERREGDVLGLTQSGRRATLRFLSLAEHRDLIVEARQVCGSVHAADPDHAGMALLAARFNGSDRIDFLGKA